MNLWWECPKCKNKVDFSKHLSYVFGDDGEAHFMVEEDCGLWLHTIFCDNCDANWVINISGMGIDHMERQ